MLVSWDIIKDFSLTRGTPIQWIDLGYSYHTKCFDSFFVLECDLNKGTEECTDFEDNFKNNGNKKINQTDSDGAQIINPKLATLGRVYQSMFCTLTTAKYSGVVAKNPDNTTNSQFVYKIYDSAGDEITDGINEADAVLTTLEWRPDSSYDIQGFCVYQQTQPTADIFLSGIMAHNIPAEYGGSKVAIRGCNIKYANYGNRETDWVGDSASVIQYDGTYFSHWNILKIYHGAGVQHDFMVEVVWYV
jgi:hypothetical protein